MSVALGLPSATADPMTHSAGGLLNTREFLSHSSNATEAAAGCANFDS
eukprot:CAMPEP_0115535850 /NCGR_PEP_ID=MMETSP0271-20121206/87470_1 /TAXON_ID=71861 /ORGANISM="Scrippsiella trochoidea, Strain CCMP3099" /LENGTH=47 /DNA_ID= /DNA_START= /DNA_END= /DNA_ORIENTATION=